MDQRRDYTNIYVLLIVSVYARDWESGLSVIAQQGGWEISRELDRAEQSGEQASGKAGVVWPTSRMFFQVGQDIRRNRSVSMTPQPVGPLPTPAPLIQRAGDVEIGGFHLIDIHWATIFSGGGLVLLILVVIGMTYCCVKGYLQFCALNCCRLCCPSDHGLGGDLEAQGRQGQGVQAPTGTMRQSSGTQMLATVPAPTAPQAPPAIGMEGAGVAEGLGYSRTLEDILEARRARKGGCGGCSGRHAHGSCATGHTMM